MNTNDFIKLSVLKQTFLLLFIAIGSITRGNDVVQLSSPGGMLKYVMKMEKDKNELFYSIHYKDQSVISDSKLGLLLNNLPDWDQNIQILNSYFSDHDSTWKHLYGEKEEIQDKYNQVIVELNNKTDPVRNLHIIVRAYDEGIAFRYFFPEQVATQIIIINGELTEFVLPSQARAWYTDRPQGSYKLLALESQLDEILPLYKSWGIAGIKFGFVHNGSHRWSVWLHDAIKKAADYEGEPEIEFFENIPTVWNETRVVDGEIGQYAIVARRNNTDWFLGAITNNDPRNLEILFNFINKETKYLASIYTDGDEEIQTRTHVKVERFIVDSQSKMKFKIKSGGGVAIHFAEAKDKDVNMYKNFK